MLHVCFRPTELLRPAVRCPTIRYNTKLRAGRGFTKAEIKAAGLRPKEALSIGIPVDHRRRNKSEEGLKLNKERIEAYRARLVVFPKKAGKVKKGDTEVCLIVSSPLNRIMRGRIQVQFGNGRLGESEAVRKFFLRFDKVKK